MARNGRTVHHNHVVGDDHIMRHMASRHQQAIIPNLRQTTATARACVHGHMLANTIARSDLKTGDFATKLLILRNFTNYGKGKNRVVLA